MRELASKEVLEYIDGAQQRGQGYCHAEEKWVPLLKFSRTKLLDANGNLIEREIYRAVCNDCRRHGRTLDKIYRHDFKSS